jgi:hypothetical protein
MIGEGTQKDPEYLESQPHVHHSYRLLSVIHQDIEDNPNPYSIGNEADDPGSPPEKFLPDAYRLP